METYRFTDDEGSFVLEGAENYSGLYFPIAGERGIKSAVTPNLGGDIKLEQNEFIMEPVSIENLHNNRSGRNFWCCIKNMGVWSATGASAEQNAARYTDMQDESRVKAGLMWHVTERESRKYQIKAAITSFVPADKNVEIMQVKITNTGRMQMDMEPVAAIPIYGRSADNIRDHRHVTSLLHRIRVGEYGIQVKPTLSFDERGHQRNEVIYYVNGMEANGEAPKEFFPEISYFIGEGGNLERPEAVIRRKPGMSNGYCVDGQEALGGLRFKEVSLAPGESAEYIIFIGACRDEQEIAQLLAQYPDSRAVQEEFMQTKEYWNRKVNVAYHTGDKNFDRFMHWVSFQPELRRLYGCSFLPHHDYGKGGRGWRDLWQDCLALLMMNPDGVRKMLLDNFLGVRMDGSNATIIGNKPGEFKADRNAITRVWMDHGVWPFITTKLYIDQTGDTEILYRKVAYFKDRQVMRGKAVDTLWNPKEQWQQDRQEKTYQGTVLEHLLLQSLTAFYEVGEHNHILLRDADWNDALDMAGNRGESVAFSNAYASNLAELADLISTEAKKGVKEIAILKEMELLLTDDRDLYDSVEKKRNLLTEYMKQCSHTVSGECVSVDAKKLAESLKHKAEWMMEHIRTTEWVTDSDGNGWFNGYYDDHGRRVEGMCGEDVRMMLTGQVFAIMAGTATEEQIAGITKSADRYLYDAKCGGYRLNTNFYEIKTDLGRMFGFAYGEKENGAVFSHMAVMYANALYKRGFVKEGFKALNSLYNQSMDFNRSRIYPGIPEYFGKGGRGLYHYLTGAASWYMLMVITRMFGVRGDTGDLVIEPKLLKQQFDERQTASICLMFAGVPLEVIIKNPRELEYGVYHVKSATVDGTELKALEKDYVSIPKECIQEMDPMQPHSIQVILG